MCACRQSCGYAVPYYEFKAHRTTLLESSKRKEDFDVALESGDPVTDSTPLTKGLKSYWAEKNAHNIDGLPGLSSAPWAPRLPKSELDLEEVRAGGGMRDATVAQAVVARINYTYEELKLVVAFCLGLLIAMASVRFIEQMGVV